MLVSLLLLATIFLSYNNGANDNFKGVATLYGSSTLNFKNALIIATITTFIGSIAAIFLANGLINSFSGKGLVSIEVANSVEFLISVALGAGITVLIATKLGFPISTTHSLVGGLLGAGIMAIGLDVNFSNLGKAFFIPLLVSPFLAFFLAAILYYLFKNLKNMFSLNKESCICFGEKRVFVPISSLNMKQSKKLASSLQIKEDSNFHFHLSNHETCVQMYTNKVFGISLQKVLDALHIFSAGAVCFARGLNDTPKIAGLLVAANSLKIEYGMVLIAIGMGLGGILHSKSVATTMSKKITKINHGQGFCANLITSFLVIIASKFGIPVSTTHVSVGSIFAIALINKNSNPKLIKSIILSWVITLPIGMVFSAICYFLITKI